MIPTDRFVSKSQVRAIGIHRLETKDPLDDEVAPTESSCGRLTLFTPSALAIGSLVTETDPFTDLADRRGVLSDFVFEEHLIEDCRISLGISPGRVIGGTRRPSCTPPTYIKISKREGSATNCLLQATFAQPQLS